MIALYEISIYETGAFIEYVIICILIKLIIIFV